MDLQHFLMDSFWEVRRRNEAGFQYFRLQVEMWSAFHGNGEGSGSRTLGEAAS